MTASREQSGERYRVVQWTTGNIGRQAAAAMIASPRIDLVGCRAWSASKVGVDVGTLCGLDPIGVDATDDVESLLALRPDCVLYTPMWPDVDELIHILDAGVNVVTTAAFINGNRLGPRRDELVAAADRGGVSLFGTGINPGFAEQLAIVTAGVCQRIDSVTIIEQANTTFYDSPDTEQPAGFGRPIDDPDLAPMAERGTAVFGEAVAMLGDALGVEFDEIRCLPEYAAAVEDLDLGSWMIPKGHVAGVAARWQGRIGDRTVAEISVRWKKGERLEPDWVIERDGYTIRVDGLPTVTTTLDFLPPPDFEAETMEDFMTIGHIITAMPAVNAIPVVVAARPGIVTYPELAMICPTGAQV